MLDRPSLSNILMATSVGLLVLSGSAFAQSKDSTFWSSKRSTTPPGDSASSTSTNPPSKGAAVDANANAAPVSPTTPAVSPKELRATQILEPMRIGPPMVPQGPTGGTQSAAPPLQAAPAMAAFPTVTTSVGVPADNAPTVPATATVTPK